jgi:hypothetical protein
MAGSGNTYIWFHLISFLYILGSSKIISSGFFLAEINDITTCTILICSYRKAHAIYTYSVSMYIKVIIYINYSNNRWNWCKADVTWPEKRINGDNYVRRTVGTIYYHDLVIIQCIITLNKQTWFLCVAFCLIIELIHVNISNEIYS